MSGHSLSRGSSWPRYQPGVSCFAGRFFTVWATREAQECRRDHLIPHSLTYRYLPLCYAREHGRICRPKESRELRAVSSLSVYVPGSLFRVMSKLTRPHLLGGCVSSSSSLGPICGPAGAGSPAVCTVLGLWAQIPLLTSFYEVGMQEAVFLMLPLVILTHSLGNAIGVTQRVVRPSHSDSRFTSCHPKLPFSLFGLPAQHPGS